MNLITRAILGLAIGSVFLWLAVSHVETKGASQALEQARVWPLIASVLVYWVAISLRAVRWRTILSGVAPLSFKQVAQCLIIGYAINNILPARLGELFRVDFLRRHCGVARSAGLGSIIVERLADGLIALALLILGLNLTTLKLESSALVDAAIMATAICASLLFGLYVILSKRHWLPSQLRWLSHRLEILTSAITGISRMQLAQVVLLSLVVWGLEAFAIWLIAWSFGVALTFSALCLVFGSAALSTLIPTAPGYLGSLQVAFVLSFSALGFSTLLGLLSATMVQLLLFGSITIVGLILLFAKHLQGFLASLVQGEKA